ncbi:hypothetical protein A3860_04630 [Niastella vici]|uniref:Uncharacterized protein n=1 Tax=Niastella vici TaxID=1703345 RepID=A0A1V9FRP1_9BACT|nr:hypothetical protein [Niastella vici]OQP61012.1 hypothetical protein A3860_04630 [Niastella vici]
MYLEINGDRLISDIQKDFCAVYPFLKIEFFKNGQVRRDRYPLNKLIPATQPVKNAWYSKKDNGQLDFNDAMTVTEFETALMEHFGLAAQVFRRSGNLWLETTITDYWTLKQQNEHGREITVGRHHTENNNNPDYELNRDPNP